MGSHPLFQRPRTIVLTLLLGAVLVVPGCVCETTGVNRGDLNIISLDEEWQIGRDLAEQILQEATVVEDPVLQSYVDEVGQEIVARTELSDRPWQFHVLADSNVNAFNIPGGHVFVNTGLIEAASSPSELAGVMAHEVAHGVARHGTERLAQAYGLNIVARLVLGDEVGLLEQIAVQMLGSGALAKFSRDDEREADRLGLEYMAEVGYDPHGMATMFETMLDLRERRPNMVERFFSTHPLTEERIAAVTERAGEFEATRPVDPKAFERMRDRARRQGA